MTAVEWKSHPEHDAGLGWAIAASAAVHAAAVVALVLFPDRFGVGKTGMMSYTVELVGASAIGGTNVVPGPKGKPQPVAVARSIPVNPEPAAAPPLPPPDVSGPETAPEPPPPAPQAAPPAPQPAPELAGPPPPPPAPAEAPAVAKPEVVIPGPKPPPPQPVAPAKSLPIAKPQEAAKPPAPKPEMKSKEEVAKKPAVSPDKKPQPTVAAKAVARDARAPASQAKAAVPSPVPAASAKASREAQLRDEQIAAAVKRRNDEQRIADAVGRRAQAARRGGSESRVAGATGGPISSGGGVGSGGVLEAMEVVLYLSEIEKRTRANWVWAGSNQLLEAKVQFEITDDGVVRNVRTVSSSGDRLYDASAERAVWAASPLPPPPVKYRERFVDGVELTFRPEDLHS